MAFQLTALIEHDLDRVTIVVSYQKYLNYYVKSNTRQ